MIDCANAADRSNKTRLLDLIKGWKGGEQWAVWGVVRHREGVEGSHCSQVAFRPRSPGSLLPRPLFTALRSIQHLALGPRAHPSQPGQIPSL